MNNFLKFLFLGALLLGTVWSSRFFLNPDIHAEEQQTLAPSLKSPPLLVLASPGKSSDAGSLKSPSAVSKAQEQTPAGPLLQSKIAMIADLQSGQEYFGYGVGNRWPLASLTKLVTAAVILYKMDVNSSTTLTAGDLVDVSEAPVEYLQEGYKYSVKDLLNVLLLASRNEAAEALARTFGRDKFLAEMNNLAKEWELSSTYFQDPSGLSAANQSTAENLKTIALKIYEYYPEVFGITRQKKFSVRELNSGKLYEISNINSFTGDYRFVGGKTGYTDEAGGNLLSIFSRNGRPILIVVLGSDDRFGDTQKLLSWFENNYY